MCRGWVDFVDGAAAAPHRALFTRDPAQISAVQVLMAMMVIKGIYAEYGVRRLNHGIGFDTAAIELLLPTYAAELGLKGRICTHWALNPHPTLIPAIEAGFIESVHSFGSELGMERYIAARPTFLPAPTARCARPSFLSGGRSLRVRFVHRRHATNGFAGTARPPPRPHRRLRRRAQHGLGRRGRRHESAAWIKAGEHARQNPSPRRGRKLVVQLVRLRASSRRSSSTSTHGSWHRRWGWLTRR